LLAHDLFRKPAPAFRGHAVAPHRPTPRFMLPDTGVASV
jgi:hypothetical protein